LRQFLQLVSEYPPKCPIGGNLIAPSAEIHALLIGVTVCEHAAQFNIPQSATLRKFVKHRSALLGVGADSLYICGNS
jgi:hypothetical protein